MSGSTFRTYVTEKEVEEVKKKRQEEWEKVRKPDQPLERPEEEYDPRTLYERLKEQKDRKQELWEEQFKFKNMIYKGLDEEEAGFLTYVAQQQAQHNTMVRRQEKEEVLAFQEAVAKARDEAELSTPPGYASNSTDLVATEKLTSSSDSSRGTDPTPPKSQKTILAASIRRKRKDSKDAEVISSKKRRLSSPPSPDSTSQEICGHSAAIAGAVEELKEVQGAGKSEERDEAVKGAGALLGLSAYSSSDSSDTDI